MKLILTSAGFVNKEILQVFTEQISTPIVESKILVISCAQSPEEEFYVNKSKEEIVQIGFENITLVNLITVDESFVSNLSATENFDVIYVCGGNTFTILGKLVESGLDKFIIEQLMLGTIYVGVSAGSIIAGPSIEVAGWGSEGDKNEVGLQDLSGFNFTDIAVYPHYHVELQGEVEEFRKKVSYRVVELTNNQAVFVDGHDVKMIGTA